jgi:uncharacterized membrane protein YkoI
MITAKKRNLLIVAVLAVTVSISTGIFVSTYTQQAESAQNQNQNNSNNTGSAGAVPLRNLTGSVQIVPKLSQIIQSKANISLGAAAASAEKVVGLNSHATSAYIRIVNGYLVYTVHVVDINNNIHRVIVDAGTGKVLSSQQVTFGNPLVHPHVIGQGMQHGMFTYPRGAGTFGHPGMIKHFGGAW